MGPGDLSAASLAKLGLTRHKVLELERKMAADEDTTQGELELRVFGDPAVTV